MNSFTSLAVATLNALQGLRPSDFCAFGSLCPIIAVTPAVEGAAAQ